MTDVLHVGTYLMCAARFEYTLHESSVAEALQYLVMSDSRLADARFRVKHFHAQSVFRVASDVAFYAPLVFDEVSPNECVVGAVSRLVEELFAQSRFCFRCLRHDEQTTRVFVNAMHQSHFWVVSVEGWYVTHVPGHSIDQCAGEVSCTRMHHHACRFVDNHQIVVFIDDVKRNILRHDAGVVLRMVEHERDDISRPHLVVALDSLSRHADAPSVGSSLNTVAAGVLHVFGQEFIDAHGRLSGVDDDAPMLISVAVGRTLGVSPVVFGRFQLVVQQV